MSATTSRPGSRSRRAGLSIVTPTIGLPVEVERHLIEVVETVGRHGEGLIDGLVRFALRGHADAALEGPRAGGGARRAAETTLVSTLARPGHGVTVMSLAAGRFRGEHPRLSLVVAAAELASGVMVLLAKEEADQGNEQRRHPSHGQDGCTPTRY